MVRGVAAPVIALQNFVGNGGKEFWIVSRGATEVLLSGVCPFGVTTANRFFRDQASLRPLQPFLPPLAPKLRILRRPIIRHLRENTRLDRNGRLPRASITKGSPEVLSAARSFYEAVSMVVI